MSLTAHRQPHAADFRAGRPVGMTADSATGRTDQSSSVPSALAVQRQAPDRNLALELVRGPEAADVIDITAPVRVNIQRVAKAKGGKPEDVTVVILDRPRHAELVAAVRAAGARIKFISDGDVAGAIMAARAGTGVDLMIGIGGTPEGIIAASAIACMGGSIQGRLWPQSPEEREKAEAAGHDLTRVLTTADLVAGE